MRKCDMTEEIVCGTDLLLSITDWCKMNFYQHGKPFLLCLLDAMLTIVFWFDCFLKHFQIKPIFYHKLVEESNSHSLNNTKLI